jgi:hypothetical protein
MRRLYNEVRAKYVVPVAKQSGFHQVIMVDLDAGLGCESDTLRSLCREACLAPTMQWLAWADLFL